MWISGGDRSRWSRQFDRRPRKPSPNAEHHTVGLWWGGPSEDRKVLGFIPVMVECERFKSVFAGSVCSSSTSPPWPEHPPLSCQASLGTYSSSPSRHPLHQSLSLDYSCHSPPLHLPHVHPAPNAHSSPRSSQRSRMARYALSRSPARSFEEQEDSSLGYGADGPNSTLQPLGNGNMDRDLLDGQIPSLLLPPHLPEKKRASDGEHSFRTASPSLSGFSSPHSGSSLSIPFPNVLPDLSSQMSGTGSPLPGKRPIRVTQLPDCSPMHPRP